MKELQEILKKISDLAPDEKAILATVVDVVGSGYRRPGARMLIDQNGYGIGTVSGGCLEADVLEHAKKVLKTNEPKIITYDTSKDENSIFGLGMGCRGIVRILLEPIEKDSAIFRTFQIACKNREKQLLATLISSNTNLPIGGRIFYSEVEQFYFVNFPTNLDFHNELIKDCEMLYFSNTNLLTNTYKIQLQTYEFFFEIINPPLNLVIFGAGYDALPLINFAKELGWRVTAIDHRPAFANKERLPEADEILVKNIEDLEDTFFQDENSVAVIMTHNYNRDREILPRLLKSNCLYIGALGSKKRTEKILAETGENWHEKLHAPIGLDIGADTPEAIALAIVAEIQAVLKNRNGGFLRERKGSIYGQNQ